MNVCPHQLCRFADFHPHQQLGGFFSLHSLSNIHCHRFSRLTVLMCVRRCHFWLSSPILQMLSFMCFGAISTSPVEKGPFKSCAPVWLGCFFDTEVHRLCIFWREVPCGCLFAQISSITTFVLLRLWFLLLCRCFKGELGRVQSLSHVRLSATPWTAARQASLSITNSRSLLKLMSIESVMPSSHLILCHSLLLLPSIFPSIRVFSNKSVLCIRWPKYWSFNFRISPSNEYSGLTSFKMNWLSLQSKGFSRVFCNTTVQTHQFFSAQLSL